MDTVANVAWGLSGLVLVGGVLRLARPINKTQRIYMLLLSLCPLAIYAVWGFMKLSFEGGQAINLGVFQLSSGLSDILAWLLVVILPIFFVGAYILYGRGQGWKKRIILPILIGLVIFALNVKSGIRILHQNFERGGLTCTTGEIQGQLQAICPD